MPYKDKAADRAYHNKWQKAWRATNPDRMREYRAKSPARNAYNSHKSGAKKRGIAFLFTFEQWWSVWETSGKWENRGVHIGEYCMARHGDTGPYAADNVRICLSSENHIEGHIGKKRSARTRELMAKSQTGKKASAEARERMTKAQQARWEKVKSFTSARLSSSPIEDDQRPMAHLSEPPFSS